MKLSKKVLSLIKYDIETHTSKCMLLSSKSNSTSTFFAKQQ